MSARHALTHHTRADDSCAFLSPEFWPTATVDKVEACIRAGVDIDARDKHGLTPLHAAAWYGTAETVAALIRAGANAKARDGAGKLPVDLAEKNRKVKDTPVFRDLNEGRF